MVMKQGATVKSIDDAVALVGAVMWQPRPRGNKTALIEIGTPGVPSVVASTAHDLERHGLTLPEFSAYTRHRLDHLVGVTNNPLRLLCEAASTPAEALIAGALRLVVGDPHIDVVLTMFGPQVSHQVVAGSLSGVRGSRCPVFAIQTGQPWPVDTLSDALGPLTVSFDDASRVGRVLAHLAEAP